MSLLDKLTDRFFLRECKALEQSPGVTITALVQLLNNLEAKERRALVKAIFGGEQEKVGKLIIGGVLDAARSTASQDAAAAIASGSIGVTELEELL